MLFKQKKEPRRNKQSIKTATPPQLAPSTASKVPPSPPALAATPAPTVAQGHWVLSLSNLIGATQNGICRIGWRHLVHEGDMMGKDGKLYRFFQDKEEIPMKVDIRSIYCHDYPALDNPPVTPSRKMSATEFWRWFSAGKCGLIHATLIEMITSFLKIRKNGASTTINLTKGGKEYSIKHAFLSGGRRPTMSVNRLLRHNEVHYEEAVFVYDVSMSSVTPDTLELKSLKPKDYDRLYHMASGTVMAEVCQPCTDMEGNECDRALCQDPGHFKIHQLTVLVVEEKNTGQETLLYVDIAGMQFGLNKVTVYTKKELALYYARIPALHLAGAYQEEDVGIDMIGGYIPSHMARMVGDAVTMGLTLS